MDDGALRIYLNDHLSGATLGRDHARQLAKMHAGTAFAAEMSRIAIEIEQDRNALLALMSNLDVRRNPVKQAGAWMSEKVGRLKFRGVSSGRRDFGRYLALETMSLGVEGKRELWTALDSLPEGPPALGQIDLAGLIARADAQREALEQQRLQLVAQAFR